MFALTNMGILKEVHRQPFCRQASFTIFNQPDVRRSFPAINRWPRGATQRGIFV